MPPLRILVTGSRSWAGWVRPKGQANGKGPLRPTARQYWEMNCLWLMLDGLHQENVANLGATVLVHGNASKGADALVDSWAIRNKAEAIHPGQAPDLKVGSLFVERHPADWNRYGTGAGNIRNTEMVRSMDTGQSHLVIVAWDGSSPGTAHCMDQARAAGLNLVRLQFG